MAGQLVFRWISCWNAYFGWDLAMAQFCCFWLSEIALNRNTYSDILSLARRQFKSKIEASNTFAYAQTWCVFVCVLLLLMLNCNDCNQFAYLKNVPCQPTKSIVFTSHCIPKIVPKYLKWQRKCKARRSNNKRWVFPWTCAGEYASVLSLSLSLRLCWL